MGWRCAKREFTTIISATLLYKLVCCVQYIKCFRALSVHNESSTPKWTAAASDRGSHRIDGIYKLRSGSLMHMGHFFIGYVSLGLTMMLQLATPSKFQEAGVEAEHWCYN